MCHPLAVMARSSSWFLRVLSITVPYGQPVAVAVCSACYVPRVGLCQVGRYLVQLGSFDVYECFHVIHGLHEFILHVLLYGTVVVDDPMHARILFFSVYWA